LQTERLTLRQASATDAEAYRLLLADPAVTQLSNLPDAAGLKQAERMVVWMERLYARGSGCAWIIEDRRSRRLIGAIRFNRFERPWKVGEIGYELSPEFWGRGLMTEAVNAVVGCGFGTFGLNRIEAWTLPGNPGSDRVLEKSGFRYEGTARQRAWFKGAFHDFRMFSRLASDPV
jgi:ribosomal-protein-alanine N-acetyltransferase